MSAFLEANQTSRKPMTKKLTPKQQTFVDEYLIDLNATQAAIRAGYSKKTAGQQGEQLLKKLEIAEAVQAAKDKRAEKTEITAEWVLREAADVYKEARDIGELNNAIRALDLCGKHNGVRAFGQEQNNSSAPDVNVVILRDD